MSLPWNHISRVTERSEAKERADELLNEFLAEQHSKEALHPNSRIYEVMARAEHDVETASDDIAYEYLRELLVNFKNNALIFPGDKLFVLRQVYVSTFVRRFYIDKDERTFEIAFRYQHAARSIYKSVSDTIQTNLARIEQEIQSRDEDWLGRDIIDGLTTEGIRPNLQRK